METLRIRNSGNTSKYVFPLFVQNKCKFNMVFCCFECKSNCLRYSWISCSKHLYEFLIPGIIKNASVVYNFEEVNECSFLFACEHCYMISNVIWDKKVYLISQMLNFKHWKIWISSNILMLSDVHFMKKLKTGEKNALCSLDVNVNCLFLSCSIKFWIINCLH